MIRKALALVLLFSASAFAGGQFKGPSVAILSSTRSVASSAGGFSCVEPTTGAMLAYYKLDDNSGTTAVDSSSGIYTGTLQASPAWATGVCGSALTFTAASSQYVSMANAPIIGDHAIYSVTGWWKTSNTAAQTIYSEGSSSSASPELYFRPNEDVAGGFEWGYRDVSGAGGSFLGAGNLSLADGQWHHFAAVQTSKSAFELYIDGVSRATGSTTVGVMTVDLATIGVLRRTTFNGYMDGSVDGLRIYDIALTAAQVSAIYASGR